ncbi:MAG: hypothetical protein ACOCWB_05125 [Bacteroidota bacterium]
MNQNENKTKELKKKLFSGDTPLVLDTIKDIRKNGTIEVIPLLLDLHILTQEAIVKQAIQSCLYDLKTPQVAPIIIDALAKKKYAHIKSFLVECMWQANIDFSKYSDTIIPLIYKESFDVAIEAMTVLETIVDSIPCEDAEIYKKQLSFAAEKKESPHKDIILQAINILQL